MEALLVFIVASVLSTSAGACDRGASRQVQAMLHQMATWNEKNEVTTFKWGADWDRATPRERLALTQSFANSDTCLTGRAREINFYRDGKLVGTASSKSGIRLSN